MRSIAVFAATTVETDIHHTFDTIVPIDLTKIFQGHVFLPAVIDTKNVTGAWDAAGQSRTVCLSDGSEAQEKLIAYNAPKTFSYEITDFTGSLKYLAKSAEGQWWFEEKSGNVTYVKWRYAFIPVSIFTWLILWVIAKVFWAGYMKKALVICKEFSEMDSSG